MNHPEQANAHHLRNAAGIVPIRLVAHRRQRRLHLPGIDAQRRPTLRAKTLIKPLR
jgi:hypothetical protein